LIPGALLRWNSAEFFEPFVVLFTLPLLPVELVLWQFLEQFRLGEVSDQVGVNLRHDR